MNAKAYLQQVMLLILGSVSIVAGAAPDAPALPTIAREQVSATLWIQRAEEYRIATESVFRLATERLPALASEPGSAAVEQAGDPSAWGKLNTAIIVDLDETILDNSYYQARQIRAGAEYDEATWQAWMQEAAATAVPGAVAFLQAASRAGHRIFYITNRGCAPSSVTDDPCPAKTATRQNLQRLGLPDADYSDALMLRGSEPEWRTSDKTSRRAWVAARYRVIALFGDDLNDFIPRADYAKRREELSYFFGRRWFLLPNPIYGSWERALLGGVCTPSMTATQCAMATTERRYGLLETEGQR
ncbi:MAG: 5'-nucleotidase, lipoprotein e(P4) family [Steroidobacteraceae bacterium]